MWCFAGHCTINSSSWRHIPVPRSFLAWNLFPEEMNKETLMDKSNCIGAMGHPRHRHGGLRGSVIDCSWIPHGIRQLMRSRLIVLMPLKSICCDAR